MNQTDIDTTQPLVPPEIQEVQISSPNMVVISPIENKKARWYVVHTYSGHENKVAETLKQRAETLNLTDKILAVLIPTQEKIQIKRGQRKTVNEKIFPGYMLVQMELTDESWLAVRTTQGVTGFVGMGNKPTPLPRHEVEAIQKYMSQATPQYKAEYVEGEADRIVEGPFNDFLGTVKSINEEKGKKGQGASAPGGAHKYVINGHMVAGFALVAWPAEYGVSGVMTFIVNQNGIVYQKDLGPKTEGIAKAMTLYNPDRTWARAE